MFETWQRKRTNWEVNTPRRKSGKTVGRARIPAFLTLVVAVGCSPIASSERHPRREPKSSELITSTALTQLPLSFIKTTDDGASQARYYVHGQGASVWFTPRSLTLSLKDRGGTSQRWGLRLQFVGSRAVGPVGEKRGAGTVSYFKGNPSEWRTRRSTYSEVSYKELWPGITLTYAGTQEQLKYTFRLSPGADPATIRLAWRGANSVRLDQDGRLVVSTPAGSLTDDAPTAYQEVGGHRVNVPASYAVDGMTYGFRLGAYDPSLPVVIDPALVVYAGFLGGSNGETGNAIAVDAQGNAYVTGEVASTETSFPVSVGPDLTHNGDSDAYVAKVSASGTALSYAGFIGGSGTDIGRSIGVDASGNAYVTGATDSTEATFPVVVGPDLTFNGTNDVFVAKVNPSGNSLSYSGYVGGSDFEGDPAIAVDAVGNAYVTGQVNSTEATFPVVVGPDLSHNGGPDTFVAKVDPSGAGLSYAGYIGGALLDVGGDIAVDAGGNAFVIGMTTSTEANFPLNGGPDLTHNGDVDAFVAKVNPSGTALSYAGYVGGSSADTPGEIAVDASGNAFITGWTTSTEATFPVSVGPDLAHNGGMDAYVAKVNSAGTALSYAGYLGGSGDEFAAGIAVDAAGNAYVTGETNSTEATFPVIEGPDLTHNGAFDVYLARVNPSGSTLSYSGFLGGSGNDNSGGIAIDAAGNAYVTGTTESTEATFPETVGPDLTHNGPDDAFLAKVASQLCMEKAATHLGNAAGDIITGTPGPDVIVALGGDDIIDGGGGDDLICAGEGNDSVTGGAGNDALDGEAGMDRLIETGDMNFILTNASLTGVGTDILASIEAATITGGPGETLIDASGFTGPVVLAGGEGEDILIGGPANDAFDGGNGHIDKVVAGGDVNFTLTNTSLTGLGNDTLAGIEVVTLYGGPSGQVIDASSFSGSTFIAAGGGADRVTGGSSRDFLFGGAGKDRLAGRGGRDILDGGPQADGLLGGAGRDRLGGRGGNDRLLGGTNRDRLNGGKGRDFCLGGPGPDTVKACEFTG